MFPIRAVPSVWILVVLCRFCEISVTNQSRSKAARIHHVGAVMHVASEFILQPCRNTSNRHTKAGGFVFHRSLSGHFRAEGEQEADFVTTAACNP
jgi:hypothetical protein